MRKISENRIRPGLGWTACVTTDEAGSSRPDRRRLVLEATLIVALTLFLNLVGNGRVGLWDRDEPRYATCTREMLGRGDWVRPTFNGQPRYHKPVLIYWLMRGGMALGGDNPFGARLVSGLAGMATCLVVWRLGRSIGGPTVGFLASVALATTPIMVAESKLATTDATLALLVISAQGMLWALSKRDRVAYAVGFWAALGLATLLKGPVGPGLVAVSGLLSWWWGGPSAVWRRIRWRTGLVVFGAITVPWYVAVGVASDGEFFRFALQTQLVQRISTGLEHHGGFPGYYALVSLPMFTPWSALVPAALVMAWTRRKVDPTSGFLLGWIVGPMVVLECVRTKLIHYYLPSYPACALIVAWWLVEASKLGLAPAKWPLGRAGVKLVGVIAIGGTLAMVVGAVIVPGTLRGACLAMALVLGGGTLAARVALARGETLRGAGTLVATWAGVMGLFVAWFLPNSEPFRLSRLVGETLASTSGRLGVRPAVMTYQEPGVIYALGRVATDVRGYDEMFAEVERNGPILVPLLPEEVAEVRQDPRFTLEPAGSVSGFNLNKGKRQTVAFAVVGASGRSLARRVVGEQSLVKAPDLPGHGLVAEPVGEPASAVLAHRLSERGVAREPENRRDQGLNLSGFEQDPGRGQDHLLRAVDVVADRRAPDQ